MTVPNVRAAGPTVKADSSVCMDFILKLLDPQVTRPTNGTGTSMSFIFIRFLVNPQPSTGLMSLYRLPFESG